VAVFFAPHLRKVEPMSMHPPAAYPPVARPEASNGLAIAAFVVALVGLLVTGGLLSPIGLILGLVALGRPGGRGFAITAIILGLLGSCGALIAVALAVIFGAGLIIAAIAFMVGAAGSMEHIDTAVSMTGVAAQVAEFRERTGSFPESLEQLSLTAAELQDPWGHPLVYEAGGADLGFDLVSPGPDGVEGTDDDIRLTQLGALFGFEDARITFEDGAGGGSAATLVAGKLTMQIDHAAGRVIVRHGDTTIFEASAGDHGGSTSESDSGGSSQNVPLGGSPDSPDTPGS
jgi:hypothetical protein